MQKAPGLVYGLGHCAIIMFLIYILTGFFAGLIVLGWQGYKDSPYENFELKKFFRSLIVAPSLGLIFFILDRFFYIKIDNFDIIL